MSKKIRNYVEVLFSDIPRTKKSQELKEEILQISMSVLKIIFPKAKAKTKPIVLLFLK